MIVFLILLTVAVLSWLLWYLSKAADAAKDDSLFAPYKLEVGGTEFTVVPQPEGSTLPVVNLAPAIDVPVKKPRKPPAAKVVVAVVEPVKQQVVKKTAGKKPVVKETVAKKPLAKSAVKTAAAMTSKKK